ncbi:MAG: hypothetical protein KIT84_23180 [Labilithrix sp.]|nr:hypothetical protein [Labilithrix sp.]MCW5813950.1 hypothetical protein [Labilithrix sp.]
MLRRVPFFVALALVVAAACNEVQTYVFVARRYDAEAGCLESYTSIDLINGSGAGSKCGPTCFRFNGSIYTTRVCPPLPESVEQLDQDSPECLAANVPDLEDSGCRELFEQQQAGDDDDDDDLDASDEGG